MDPNANLREQLSLARHITRGGDMTREEWDAERDRLAELVLALHTWIAKGGFLPAQWQKGQTR